MPIIYIPIDYWDPFPEPAAYELGSEAYWAQLKTWYPSLIEFQLGDHILYSHDASTESDISSSTETEVSSSTEPAVSSSTETERSSSTETDASASIPSEKPRSSPDWAWGYRVDRHGLPNWSFCGTFPKSLCRLHENTEEPYRRVRLLGCFAETLLFQALRRWPDLPFLGELKQRRNGAVSTPARDALLFDSDSKLPEDAQFKWMSFGSVERCAQALRRAMQMQLALPSRAAVGICGGNSVDWVLADLACALGSFISVPLYCGAEVDKYQFIVKQADIKVIFCDDVHFKLFSSLFNDSSLILIPFGHSAFISSSSSTLSSSSSSLDITQLILNHLNVSTEQDFIPTQKSDILTLMYTSGSTGRPKGAIMTEDRWSRFLCENYRVTYPYRIMTVSQLPHIMERQNIYISMFAGGHYAMFDGDPSELIDVMRHYRPSEITVVPRFFQSLHAAYIADLKLLLADRDLPSLPPPSSPSSPVSPMLCDQYHPLVKENLIDFGYADGYSCDRCQTVLPCALRWRCNPCAFDVCPSCLPLDSTPFQQHTTTAPTLSAKASKLLGALDPSVQTRLALEAVELPLRQKYREMLGGNIQYVGVGGALSAKPMRDWIEQCFNCVVLDGYGATEVGGISTENLVDSSAQIRLESAPDLGYTVDDLPYPRGQILVKTELSVPGYYNDPDATREAFTEDGFWRSGDIGEMHPDGRLLIIDRVKSIFKLSQGEYVAPEPLEQLFCQSPLVSQCFIYGQPQWDHLVAVVVPQMLTLRANQKILTLRGCSDQQIVAHPLSAQVLLEELRRVAAQAQLASYKVPKTVLLDPIPLTFERGFLTASMKYKRAELVKYYAPLFADLSDRDEAGHRDAPVEVSAARLVALVDACHNAPLQGSVQSFADLDRHLALLRAAALDSLQNMQTVLTLRAKYHVPLEVRDFVNADARMLCALLQNPASLSLELTHARYIADWNNTTTTTTGLSSNPSQSSDCFIPLENGKSVLITGATGAIGTQLMIQLLMIPHRAPVICIVRAQDDAQALDRVRRCVLQGGMTPESFESAQSRLQVFAGDVAMPRFGLSEQRYAGLQAQVGLVYHLAAQVNWNMPYEALRQTNVEGTLLVSDFCLRAPHPVQMVHVSTVSVAESMAIDGPSRAELNATLNLDGYTQSKLIAERFISRRVATEGLSAIVVRPAMITGHSDSGLSNLSDFVPRYLVGIARLQCYPVGTGRKQDMFPVDHLARILAAFAIDGLPAFSLPMHQGAVLGIADDDPLSFDRIGQLTDAYLQRHNQPPLQPVTYQAFHERLLAAPSNPLFPFLSTLFETDAFHAGLADDQYYSFQQSPSAISQPSSKDMLIEKYLSYLMN